jgi:hypothetical protein
VAKPLARLTVGVAALVTATWLGTASSRAYGNAPWCAVTNIAGGDVYWDCQYPTFEACYHLSNILAGNRGFCAVNSLAGTVSGSSLRYPRRYSPY